MSKLSKKQRELLINTISLLNEQSGARVSDIISEGEFDDLILVKKQLEEDNRRETKRLDLQDGELKKCRIQKYDPKCTEAPYTFITLGEFEVKRPSKEFDDTGEVFARRLIEACEDHGYSFRFYSICRDGEYDYNVTVQG